MDLIKMIILIAIFKIHQITYSKAQELLISNLIDQPILILDKHPCKLQIGNINIIHEINLTDIENTITLLNQSINRPTNSPLSEIAKHKINNVYSNLYQIKPRKRQTRSIEAIGSVWKWIGGSPDAHDLQIINRTMNDLIESNNQQYQFNEHLGNRIKILTNEVKQIIEVKNDVLLTELDMLTTMINIDTINKILEDIKDAILLSKMSVTNSKILSPREYAIIKRLLEDQGVETDIPEEALTYVTPKIAVSKEKLLYILKVPQLQEVESKIIEIIAINHNNSVIRHHPRYLLQHKKILYTTTKPEEYVQRYSYTMEFIDNCIFPLVMGKESNCIVVQDYTITAKLIADNLLLIENANGQLIKTDCGPNDRILRGNFLLTFSNCTIQFENQTFTSKEIHVKSPSVSGTTFNTAIHRKIVETPLASLDNRTLTNRNHIEHIYLQQYKNITWNWSLLSGIGLSFAVSLILIIIAYCYLSHLVSAIVNQIGKRKSRLQNEPRNHRSEATLVDRLDA